MPIYNVTLTLETTVVVVADDAEHAIDVARDNARRAIEDAPEGPHFDVRGEVTSEKQLRDGWDAECVPYGGDGNTRIGAMLTPNAKVSGTGTASAGLPGYAAGGNGEQE